MKYEDLIPTFESKINSLKTLDVESEDYRIINIEIRSFLFGLFEELGQQSTETKEFVIKSFENFPEIYADIVSASDSPNCACRGRVASFFQENPGIALDIFKNILNKFPQDEIFYTNVFEKIRSVVAADNAQNIDPATIKNTPMKSLNGRVISITNSSQEYFKVIQSLSMQGYKYNGISVVENNDNLKLYFY
jgi:hypothetical protein